MAIEFKLPNMTEREPGQAVKEINNFLFQMVQQLNIVIGQQEKKIEKTAEDANRTAKQFVSDSFRGPRATFEQIRKLIAESVEIRNALEINLRKVFVVKDALAKKVETKEVTAGKIDAETVEADEVTATKTITLGDFTIRQGEDGHLTIM